MEALHGQLGFGEETRRKLYILLSKQRFSLCIMIFLGLLNVYTLRNTINVAIIQMTNKNLEVYFDWNEKQKSQILSSFYWGYVPVNIVSGRLAEKFGGKRIFGLGIALTSVITILIPLASQQGIVTLIVVRFLQGCFEGLALPAMYTIFGRWFPKSERSILRILCESGFDFGYIVGNPLTGFLCGPNGLGWTSVFYIFGVSGIVWYFFWWIFIFETPTEHPTISTKERSYILNDQGDEIACKNPPAPYLSILKSPPIWSLAIGTIISGLFVQFIRQDYPLYLHAVYNYNPQQIGWRSSLPFYIDLVVAIFSGAVADFMISRCPNHRTLIRKSFNIASTVPAVVALLGVIFVGNQPDLVISLMAVSYGLGAFDAAGSPGTIVDMSPVFAGTIFGLLNAIGNLSGIFCPLLIGYVTNGRAHDRSVWNTMFYVSIVLNILSTVIFVIFGSSDLQSWGLTGERNRNISVIQVRPGVTNDLEIVERFPANYSANLPIEAVNATSPQSNIPESSSQRRKAHFELPEEFM